MSFEAVQRSFPLPTVYICHFCHYPLPALFLTFLPPHNSSEPNTGCSREIQASKDAKLCLRGRTLPRSKLPVQSDFSSLMFNTHKISKSDSSGSEPVICAFAVVGMRESGGSALRRVSWFLVLRQDLQISCFAFERGALDRNVRAECWSRWRR